MNTLTKFEELHILCFNYSVFITRLFIFDIQLGPLPLHGHIQKVFQMKLNLGYCSYKTAETLTVYLQPEHCTWK